MYILNYFSGICCPHRGAVFSYTWRFCNFPFQPDDRVACNVFFVWELLRPLLKGIPLYVIPDTIIYDPLLLLKFLKKHGITRVLFTPSLLGIVDLIILVIIRLGRAHSVHGTQMIL